MTAATRALVAGRKHPYNLLAVLTALGLTSGLKLCLDAGDALSYTSGQSWLDRSGNGYNFFLGATGSGSTDDPTFNGTPDLHSVNEYFSFDGGDFFTYDSANETWMQNLHKDNAQLSIISFYRQGGDLDDAIFFATAGATPDVGCNFFHSASGGGTFSFQALNGGGFALSVSGASDPADNTWHMTAVSLNEATGAAGGFLYLDGAFNQVSAANTFNSTYAAPSAASATLTATIGKRGIGGTNSNGIRQACLAMWEGTALTKANMDAIWTAMRGRFGI